jgi:hypothetical protein
MYWCRPLRLQSVQVITKPSAGDTIAFLCAKVILGGKKPFVVDVTSRAAEAFGARTPMPTLPPRGWSESGSALLPLNPDCTHPEKGGLNDLPISIPSLLFVPIPTLKTPVEVVPGIVGLLALPTTVSLLPGAVVPTPTFCAIS